MQRFALVLGGVALILLGVGAGLVAALAFLWNLYDHRMHTMGALAVSAIIGVPGVYSACRGLYLVRTAFRRTPSYANY